MSEGISDSRFYMWRAVIALAHADGRIADEERNFVDQYLDNVPFSSAQRDVLRSDIGTPQDVAAMFDLITAPEDQGEFFEFARMIVWCDGNYDAQEQALFERLKGTQMARVDQGAMQKIAHDTRESGRLVRAAEEQALEEHAEQTLGLGAILTVFTGGVK